MGDKTGKNFHKRFGERISVTFSERPPMPTEQKARSEALSRAITEVMAGVLKREPTEEEVLGLKDISILKRRREK